MLQTRNTPTSVGKTHTEEAKESGQRKHPHERGEDDLCCLTGRLCLETPPRAWGRPVSIKSTVPLSRNTPTSVGKTRYSLLRCRLFGETPPRAWGRLTSFPANAFDTRNTPTSVGKTLDFTGVDGGLVEIRFVALSVFQSQGACLKFQ